VRLHAGDTPFTGAILELVAILVGVLFLAGAAFILSVRGAQTLPLVAAVSPGALVFIWLGLISNPGPFHSYIQFGWSGRELVSIAHFTSILGFTKKVRLNQECAIRVTDAIEFRLDQSKKGGWIPGYLVYAVVDQYSVILKACETLDEAVVRQEEFQAQIDRVVTAGH
jgi:hypothetical protein